MPLPEFNDAGDLPEALYESTIEEIIKRFGTHTAQRQKVATRLLRISKLATATGKLQSLIILGSFVTNKPDPNDVDIVLIMKDDFNQSDCDEETEKLFEHSQADSEFGASIFWIRPSLIFLESLNEFITHWQLKRDGTRRGIVEVRV